MRHERARPRAAEGEAGMHAFGLGLKSPLGAN